MPTSSRATLRWRNSQKPLGAARGGAYIARMSSGRINSKASIATMERMLRAAGNSWERVERVAHRDENGVYVVHERDLRRAVANDRKRDPD